LEAVVVQGLDSPLLLVVPVEVEVGVDQVITQDKLVLRDKEIQVAMVHSVQDQPQTWEAVVVAKEEQALMLAVTQPVMGAQEYLI
jgi:hypothetical protein